MLPRKDFLTEVIFSRKRVGYKFSKHEILFKEEDKADKAYYICKGIIAIIKRNTLGESFKIYTINSNEVIGIQDVYNNGIYNTTAIALVPVVAYAVTRREIEYKLNQKPFLKPIFAKWLSSHLLTLENKLFKM